ncbi:MAG: helix-turn-helix domain-containing protein [Treponema sp.]|jgi:transcriptional regulator with XRE-family HTH domain|nr:helix-turn-helix domain-containing protein [Treponema sp.]
MDGQAIKDTLGKNIKILRARRGLSQADFAEKADISIPFLSNIERGIKYPQPDMLSKIVTALGVEVNDLFAANLESGEGNKLLNHMSEDITKNVNLAMAKVFKRYLGKSPVPK